MTVTKRLAAPKFWPIEKKTKKFVISPTPGPHAKSECIPTGLLLRDVLKYARTSKEAKSILNKRFVKIDGKVRKDIGFPVGLMDVFSIGNEHYRVLPSKKGLKLIAIEDSSISVKLCRIENKQCIGKKIQLNLHDGRNILVDKDDFNTGDTVVLDLGNNAVKNIIKMKKGSLGLIISGKNSGKIGNISEIITTKSPHPNKILMETDGRLYEVLKNYVFVVGHEKPVINLFAN